MTIYHVILGRRNIRKPFEKGDGSLIAKRSAHSAGDRLSM